VMPIQIAGFIEAETVRADKVMVSWW
jgi:hypothetical protein